MTDFAAVSRARWAECARRMEADCVPEAMRPFRDAHYMRQIIADEEEGRWSPHGVVDAPGPATAPSPAPVSCVPVPTPAADPAVPVAPEDRARSMWTKAVAGANAEAQGDATRPADPQADAASEAQIMPAAGSVQRSRSAWGRAVADVNAELARRCGRVGEV